MHSTLWIICLLSGMAQASWDASTFNQVMAAKAAPTRLGVLKMRPLIDNEKPLALINVGGFVAVDDSLIGEINSGEVASINLKSGVQNWTYVSENRVSAPILLNRDYLYVAFLDGSLAKLDKISGELKWKTNAPNVITRSMTIQGSKLFFVTGMQELGCIDVQSGKQEWVVESMRPSGLQILNVSSPLVDDGTVFIANQAGRIEGFEAKNGVRIFSTNIGSVEGRFADIVASPVIVGQLIITARYDGLVAAFDRKSPEKAPIWKTRINSVTEVKSYSGSLYLTTSTGDLIAMNPIDGRVVWKTNLDSALSVLEVRETSILVSGPSGTVAKIDRASGSVLWRESLKTKIISPPLYYGGGLWFLTGLGNLYGYLIH